MKNPYVVALLEGARVGLSTSLAKEIVASTLSPLLEPPVFLTDLLAPPVSIVLLSIHYFWMHYLSSFSPYPFFLTYHRLPHACLSVLECDKYFPPPDLGTCCPTTIKKTLIIYLSFALQSLTTSRLLFSPIK